MTETQNNISFSVRFDIQFSSILSIFIFLYSDQFYKLITHLNT